MDNACAVTTAPDIMSDNMVYDWFSDFEDGIPLNKINPDAWFRDSDVTLDEDQKKIIAYVMNDVGKLINQEHANDVHLLLRGVLLIKELGSMAKSYESLTDSSMRDTLDHLVQVFHSTLQDFREKSETFCTEARAYSYNQPYIEILCKQYCIPAVQAKLHVLQQVYETIARGETARKKFKVNIVSSLRL